MSNSLNFKLCCHKKVRRVQLFTCKCSKLSEHLSWCRIELEAQKVHLFWFWRRELVALHKNLRIGVSDISLKFPSSFYHFNLNSKSFFWFYQSKKDSKSQTHPSEKKWKPKKFYAFEVIFKSSLLLVSTNFDWNPKKSTLFH